MQTSISTLELFQILRQSIGDKQAQTLTEYVEAKIKEKDDQNLKVLATKEDLSSVKEEVLKLDTKISETKAELLRWMFIFWSSQLVALITIIKFFFTK